MPKRNLKLTNEDFALMEQWMSEAVLDDVNAECAEIAEQQREEILNAQYEQFQREMAIVYDQQFYGYDGVG